MKREDWQKAYAPRGDALEIRVRNTLNALPEGPTRRIIMKRAWAITLALVLVMAAAVALAAGLMTSDKVDIKEMAEQALSEQYGLTAEMVSFFSCAVDEAAGTVVYTPVDAMAGTERLGVYTVTMKNGKAEASWSHDGETVGSDTSSAVWDAKLFGEALARKAAGEEWFVIEGIYTPEQLEINVTEEQAAELARKAIEEKFGADALDGFELQDAHRHVVAPEEVAKDGHGLWRYSVNYSRENEAEGLVESYVTRIYADDGSVFVCRYKTESVMPEPEITTPEGYQSWTEYYTAQAFARAEISPKEALALAKEAIVQRYGLTQEQAGAMELHDTWTGFGMVDDKPVYDIWFYLWMVEDGPWSEGDGLYGASVNVETGVIEDMDYDSTLGGNG